MYKSSNSISRYTLLLALSLLTWSYVCAQSSAPLKSGEEITAKVSEYMNAAVKVNGFSGTILIARDGKPIVSRGYAMANVEHGVSNAPNTVFRLGSVTKQFTGMAISMLQERKKLSVGDSLCKYITECPEIWKPITIKHLLTHTSGIPNYTSFPDFAKTTILPITNPEMIALLKPRPLDFKPGEKFAYSNSGYYLLGEIIEKASGKSYTDFLQENIFTPLGMKQTGYDSPIRIIKNRAAGYARQAGKTLNASYMDMSVPYSAGALYSTTGDLLRWDQALYTEKLVSKKSLEEMFTPLKGDSGYAYGWGVGKAFKRRSTSHGGGIFGFSTHIARYPDDNVTVIVLSNIQGAPSGRIGRDLSAIVFGAKYEIPKERKEITLAANILEKYVGRYQLTQPKVLITVTLRNGKLHADLGGIAKFALSAESETKFFSRDMPVVITFTKDSKGQVTGLTYSQGGGAIPGKRIK